MKKSVVAVTAAFLAASVVPAMALDAKFSGEFRTRGEYFNEHFLEKAFYDDILGDRSEATKKTTLWDSRMRLRMDLAANENLKGVYVMQVGDVTWGSDGFNYGADRTYPALKGGAFADRRIRRDHPGGTLNSNEANVQTKNMYIDFNLPSTPVNAKVGILPLKLGHGIVLDADASALLVQAKTDPVTIGAATFKTHEGDIQAQDDSDYYLLFANASLQNSGSVGLFGIYNRNRRAVDDGSDTFIVPGNFDNGNSFVEPGTDNRIDQYWVGLTADLTLDPIFINLEADGYWAQIHRPDFPKNNDHVDGFAGYLNIGANVKPVKVGVAGLYATGQKRDSDSPDYFSPIMPTRPQDKTLLDWDTIVLGQLRQNILTNMVSAKAYVDVTPIDALTVGISAQPYWLQQCNNQPGLGNHRYLGTEADANISVRIYENLVYKVSGAYMWTTNRVFAINKGDEVSTATVTGSETSPAIETTDTGVTADRDYKHQNIWFVGNQLVYSF